jgi:hypothetical protein
VDRTEDRSPDHRTGRHPEERERSDDAQRARPGVAAEQVRRGGRGDRHEDAAPRALQQACADQLVKVLGGPGQRRPDHEHEECPDEQPAGTPQVGQPPGERHRDDVHEEVAVDDPARLAELDPRRATGRCDEVDQDRGQRDGRDHELEPGQEDPGSEHDEQHERGAAIHSMRSVAAGRVGTAGLTRGVASTYIDINRR